MGAAVVYVCIRRGSTLIQSAMWSEVQGLRSPPPVSLPVFKGCMNMSFSGYCCGLVYGQKNHKVWVCLSHGKSVDTATPFVGAEAESATPCDVVKVSDLVSGGTTCKSTCFHPPAVSWLLRGETRDGWSTLGIHEQCIHEQWGGPPFRKAS